MEDEVGKFVEGDAPVDQAPERFERRILLVVSGLFPQVVTENLYALCCQRQPRFIPTELHLVTTGEGLEHAELGLFHPKQGHYWQFLKDYGLEGQITFTPDHIHVLKDRDNKVLDDLRTERDMASAADALVTLVRELTKDPESALHVSITGGRNAVGVYLGLAMTLYARPQDRLSQVMVNDTFLANHDFYYPPPEPEVLVGNCNTLVSTANAGIQLAEIPIVSLRHGLPERLLAGETSYMDTVAAAKRSFAPPRLVIDIKHRRLVCGDQVVMMPPQLFAWYAWMARRRQGNHPHGGHVSWRDPGIAEDFLAVYGEVVGTLSHDYEEAARTLVNGMTKEFFDEKKSRVNRWLKEELGLSASHYLIISSGRRPTKRFGLEMANENSKLPMAST